MSERWREIWNRRRPERGQALSLDLLIALNGFDTGDHAVKASEWRLNAQRVVAALDVNQGECVFEVGCGSGAFLFAIQEQVRCRVSGIDFSGSLIDVARELFPGSRFDVASATDMGVAEACDHALAHSVFQYLTLDEAACVIRRMLSKARRSVGIFELPNLDTRDAAESVRRGNLPAGEYEKKYEGLAHTYYDKAWLVATVRQALPDASIEFIDSQIDNNPQSPFRFGMIIRKHASGHPAPACSKDLT